MNASHKMHPYTLSPPSMGGIYFCNNTASPTMKHRIHKHMVHKFHTLLLFSILLLTTKFPARLFFRIVFWNMMLWHQLTVPHFLRQYKSLILKGQNFQEFFLDISTVGTFPRGIQYITVARSYLLPPFRICIMMQQCRITDYG